MLYGTAQVGDVEPETTRPREIAPRGFALKQEPLKSADGLSDHRRDSDSWEGIDLCLLNEGDGPERNC